MTSAGATLSGDEFAAPRQRPLDVRALLQRFAIGAILALILIVLIFGPHLTPYDPIAIAPNHALAPPGPAHPFGTDQYGRDVMSRVFAGSRLSIFIGVFAVMFAALIGVPVGLIAGYFRGIADEVIMRVTDILLAFPNILLALTIVAITGPGTSKVMFAVGISLTATYIRLVRGVVLVVREQLYVEAARAIGCSAARIMARHLLPNILGPVMVLSTVAVAWSIIAGASLSFLGLGPSPPVPEWGVDLSRGRDYLDSAWWISTFPGLAIIVTVLAINMLGDQLVKLLDPALRHQTTL